MTKAKVKTKTKVEAKRCPKCRKPKTLIDISGEMQDINPFTIRRSYIGIQCDSCGWNQKTYEFEEGKD